MLQLIRTLLVGAFLLNAVLIIYFTLFSAASSPASVIDGADFIVSSNAASSSRGTYQDRDHPSIALHSASGTTTTTTTTINNNNNNSSNSNSNSSSNSSYAIAHIIQQQQQQQQGYIRHDKIFGHVHMAKSAGSEINGELAARFERVCGHKGYSYDAVQYNQRVAESIESTGKTHLKQLENGGGEGGAATTGDVISKVYDGYSRGRIPARVMVEIGYEDCDYISVEEPWHKWNTVIAPVWPLELHVPCRDPLDHLMSQCNHRLKKFKCKSNNLQQEIKKCLLFPDRFDLSLTRIPNVTMKCFNPLPVGPYIQYMGRFLQERRIETKYIHRDTNKRARKKENECIWKNTDVANRVLKILLEKYDYYNWCQKCMGSANDLLFGG